MQNHTAGPHAGNLLLDALPEPERSEVIGHVTPIFVPPKRVLREPGGRVETVYFPLNGMISLTTVMSDGSSVEIGTVGREGVVGVPEALTADSTSTGQAIGQVTCNAVAMDAGVFRRLLGTGGELSRLVPTYISALFELVSLNASCNRLHQNSQRLARWLLLTANRCGDRFELTHEFMSQMLGVRRSTVTESAQELQDSRLISYTRGRIEILDRQGLEGATCECYSVIQSRFQLLEELYRGSARSF